MSSAPATFECLDLSFSVQTSDPILGALVADLYDPCRSERPPTVEFSVTEEPGGPRYAIHRGSTCVRTTNEPSMALAHLVWEISQSVLQTSARSGQILLHAAAAALDERAVLLPAASGSGKSTLVAALVSCGLSYLTDDVAAVDGDQGLVLPYPKPLAVGLGLRRKFPQTLPVPEDRYPYLGAEGFLTAQELGGTVGIASHPRAIVQPRYRPHAPTRSVPLSAGHAVQLLAEQCFDLHTYGPGSLDLLASVSTGCRRFALEYSDVHEAAAFVMHELVRGE